MSVHIISIIIIVILLLLLLLLLIIIIIIIIVIIIIIIIIIMSINASPLILFICFTKIEISLDKSVRKVTVINQDVGWIAIEQFILLPDLPKLSVIAVMT